jgi:hypothetical protein
MGKCLLKFGIEVTDQIGFHPHTPEQMVRWTLKVRTLCYCCTFFHFLISCAISHDDCGIC